MSCGFVVTLCSFGIILHDLKSFLSLSVHLSSFVFIVCLFVVVVHFSEVILCHSIVIFFVSLYPFRGMLCLFFALLRFDCISVVVLCLFVVVLFTFQ